MLTSGQIAHFETFGFLVLRQLLSQDEISIMKRESVEIFDEERGGTPYIGGESEAIQPFLERRPFLSKLVDDDRIYNIGVDLCGPDFVLASNGGALHVGDTPWHRDASLETPIKDAQINFYTQPLTRDTGCLRVIPGSHHLASPDSLALLMDRSEDPDFMPFGVRPSEIPGYAVESQPGDVVVFTESLAHASFGGEAGRHHYGMNFIANPKTDEQTAYIKSLYKSWKYGLRPAESYVNSDRPRIRRMVSRLVELGFETSKV